MMMCVCLCVRAQVVIVEFEGGVTASLTTVAFTEAVCVRETRVFGSAGERAC